MVGVPMLKAERISCSGPKLSDAQTRNFEAIKYSAEGFFGLLKQEFFHPRDWRGVGLAEFMSELDAWMRWFRSGRISQALGWLTPDEHRLALGYAL